MQHIKRGWPLVVALLALLMLTACGANAEPEGITVGADAPDFTLPKASGGEVSLSDYEGEPVLLYFHMAVG